MGENARHEARRRTEPVRSAGTARNRDAVLFKRYLRRRRIAAGVAAFAVLAILAAGGYTWAAWAAPLPELRPTLSVTAETWFEAEEPPAEAALAAQRGPTAIGWAHDDRVWANDETPYRIASIAKLVTTLVGLEAAPVEAGTSGPLYTVSGEDQRILSEVIAMNGAFAPAPIGLELTTRQVIELMLVPSANNYAIAYARWVFGSDEAYLQAASDWLARHGLESIRIADASGLSNDNVGSAADVVRLSRLVLEHPLLAAIVKQSTIEIPELGLITTTNRLLGEPGVIGLKTGTSIFGYNLAAARHEAAEGRSLVSIAVVLERDEAEDRANDARAALRAVAGAWQTVPLVEEGEAVGTITAWTGEEVSLVAASGAETVLLPGETARRSNELLPVRAGDIIAGSSAGAIRISAPMGDSEIEVVIAEAIEEPGLWWRLTNPGVVFG